MAPHRTLKRHKRKRKESECKARSVRDVRVLLKGSLPLMTINIPVPSITSWKTTLGGLLSLFVGAMASYNDASFNAAIHDFRVQMAVVVGIIGLLAKDSNVTGGTKPSTPEAAVRVEEEKVEDKKPPLVAIGKE